ncbi:MAG: mannose-6-phosphate isomerase [bacterium]|nr:mannose-6-phosphate isomerase [bacterium]
MLKDYVWGGRDLERLLGRNLPEGTIAESWEISDHPNGETAVTGGAWEGATIRELLRAYGPRLVGSRNRSAVDRDRFPLLIKLLDANEWLSVQVHPGDAYARKHEDDLGKTEMWVVLHAAPDAEIILGFDRPTNIGALAEALERDELETLLQRVPARQGDVFFVPAGTVHAIGPGLVLAEIQQTSDVTYRVYDWGRQDSSDQGRSLRLERALEVTNFESVRPGTVEPEQLEAGAATRELLVDCPYFRTERLRLDTAGYRAECDGSTFEIWGALSGTATISSRRGAVDLESVSWALLPADLGAFEVRSEARAELLRVSTPPR